MKKGADLECLLAYEIVDYEYVSYIFDFIKERGFDFQDSKAFLLYGSDYILPEIITSEKGLQKIKEAPFFKGKFRSATILCEGIFFDVNVELSIFIEFDLGVISFSINEGFIWNFDSERNNPKIERLKSYAIFCQEFTNGKPPIFATMQNFGVHSEDIAIANLSEERKERFIFRNDFLSSTEVEHLFNWYTKEYCCSR